MTTINNSENLIEKVGGIEKAREIVNGAPEWAKAYNIKRKSYTGASWFYGEVWLDDLRTAIAEHDSKIKCWSCDKYMTENQRSANDGFCIHCGNEIEAERHG